MNYHHIAEGIIKGDNGLYYFYPMKIATTCIDVGIKDEDLVNALIDRLISMGAAADK